MRSALLANATDISLWAVRRDAQDTMPQLLRRLVHATSRKILRSNFRAGEGVQLGGWDGIVDSEEGNAFVPAGISAWETGTGSDVWAKAESDYASRCADPRGVDPLRSAFIFVTPRRWPRRQEWVDRHSTEGIWGEVRAYDADSLEEWLELAPAVHVWLSIHIGKHPIAVVDLSNAWSEWSAATNPPISADFVLAGRNSAVEAIHSWLRGSSPTLSLSAESREESLAVFAAALRRLPPDEQMSALACSVIVHSEESMRLLGAQEGQLVLVPMFENRGEMAQAISSGHRIVIPLGRADSATDASVEIARLSREEATKSLEAIGFSEDRARALSLVARRGLMAFRRTIAISREVQQPEWARPENGRAILPAFLVGGWDALREGDREAISKLSLTSYDELSAVFVRWANHPDPPVRKIGDSWYVISREDSWSLLAKFCTRDDFERFKKLTLDVFGTVDPSFDRTTDEPWTGSLFGKPPRWSALLRTGLADTLAFLGARGDVPMFSGGISARDYVNAIIGELLRLANGDYRLWASVADLLPLLAEAAPEPFLSAVDEGLKGDSPVLLRLFNDREGLLFGHSPHTGLLWALETLAWNPEFLGHVTLLLARLTRLDPGGKLGNRPKRSLHDIFLLWHPQTTANLEQRLKVLDHIREREPDVYWQLRAVFCPNSMELGTSRQDRTGKNGVPREELQ